jgi:ureidoglycolate dehydrogenase (NAD+)
MASVTEAELRRFIVAVLQRREMAEAQAAQIADVLIWANLRGVDSHGVARLPAYVGMIDKGVMNVAPALTVSKDLPAGFVVAADRAPGPVAINYALDLLVSRTRQQGVATALIVQMTHSGALGYYAAKAADSGLACLAINASIPLMPYHGALGAAVGTNPLAMAVPGGEGGDPLVLDMAASVVSLGKLLQARRTGAPLEPGWFVDDAGLPTTEPAKASMTVPLGGAKGAGLSLMIECFASLLAANPIVADALQGTGGGGRHRQNALLIAFNIAAFVDLAAFRNEVARLAQSLKALPPAPGGSGSLMPGERGFAMMAKRRAEGIPLPPPVLAELTELARRLHAPPLQAAG